MSGDMKRELASIKSQVRALDDRVSTMDGRMAAMDKRMMVMFSRLESKIDQMSVGFGGRLTRLESAVDGLFTKMDGFARIADDWRLRYAVHSDLLLEHDSRLKKLESRQ